MRQRQQQRYSCAAVLVEQLPVVRLLAVELRLLVVLVHAVLDVLAADVFAEPVVLVELAEFVVRGFGLAVVLAVVEPVAGEVAAAGIRGSFVVHVVEFVELVGGLVELGERADRAELTVG